MADQKSSNANTIAGIIVVIVVLIGGFFVGNHYLGRSERSLKNNIAVAIRKEDGKLFLRQFDRETQKAPGAQIGAEYVVKDLHNHSLQSPTKAAQTIIDGKKIPGIKHQYFFQTDQSRKIIFSKKFLTTNLNPIKFKSGKTKLNQATFKFKNDDKKYQLNEIQKGLFPGKYYYSIKASSGEINYQTGADDWIRVNGDGKTLPVKLNLGGKSKRDINNNAIVKKLTAIETWHVTASPEGYDNEGEDKYSVNLSFSKDGTYTENDGSTKLGYTISRDNKYLILTSSVFGSTIEKIKISSIKDDAFTGTAGMNGDSKKWEYSFENFDSDKKDDESKETDEDSNYQPAKKKSADTSLQEGVLSTGIDKLDLFDGNWSLVSSEGEPMGVPTSVVIDNANISLTVGGDTSDYPVDDFHWDTTDQAYYLQNGQSVICSVAMVNQRIDGQVQTVMKYNNQGSIGYFTR